MAKDFFVKVYNSSGTYLGLINDIANISFTMNINGGVDMVEENPPA